MIRYRYSGFTDAVIRVFLRAGRKARLLRYFDVDDFPSFTEVADAVRQFGTKDVLLVSGFRFRDNDLLTKYHDSIVSRYRNADRNLDVDHLSCLKQAGKTMIGLHIRLGDYRDYGNGCYFYSIDQYVRWAWDFIATNGIANPVLAVFSDQKLSHDDFKGFPEVFVSHNSYNVDYELMGLCDYLIGPPSTFTQWASYTYHIPYFHIADRSVSKIRISDFCIAFCD